MFADIDSGRWNRPRPAGNHAQGNQALAGTTHGPQPPCTRRWNSREWASGRRGRDCPAPRPERYGVGVASRPGAVVHVGPVILTESRQHTDTATIPVPWSGDREAVQATEYRSPILTPGQRGIRSPAVGVQESPLPVLHLSDVSAGLRSFETLWTGTYAS